MMNKRNFAALVAGVALLAAGMLAGCGPKDEAPADTAAPGATTTAPAGGDSKMAASPAASASPAAGGVTAPPGPAAK